MKINKKISLNARIQVGVSGHFRVNGLICEMLVHIRCTEGILWAGEIIGGAKPVMELKQQVYGFAFQAVSDLMGALSPIHQLNNH